jgi:hypothetical protein
LIAEIWISDEENDELSNIGCSLLGQDQSHHQI